MGRGWLAVLNWERWMLRVFTIAARVILGLMFLLPGLTGITRDIPAGVLPLLEALSAMRYFIPLLSVVYVTAGLMLVSGWFVPLGLLLLAPILVNIVLAHLFLDLQTIGEPLLGVCLELWLLWRYRRCFRGVLSSRGWEHEEIRGGSGGSDGKEGAGGE